MTWVYNILDGTSEAENVLVRTDAFVIVKDYKWDVDAGPEKICWFFQPPHNNAHRPTAKSWRRATIGHKIIEG